MNALRNRLLRWLLAFAWCGCLHAQSPYATGTPSTLQDAPPSLLTTVRQAPSSLLQPALDSVARAGSAVDLNRWKGSSAAREEVDANLASIQKDLQTTLPPLLTAADAAPGSAAASLPVLLNLDALYSVLLRVAIASRTGAPRDQNTSLEQAATVLDSARRDLGEAVLAATKIQEQRTAVLQATVQQQAAAMATSQQVPATSNASTKAKKRVPSTKTADR